MCEHRNLSHATSADMETVCADCGEVVMTLEEKVGGIAVMPVIGHGGMLLGVTINGVTFVRPMHVSYDDFAITVLNRIVTLPRDKTSKVAQSLIESDKNNIESLHAEAASRSHNRP